MYLYMYIPPLHRDKVSLCNPGCPGTYDVDQGGPELRDLPAS